jgi:membrane protein implicated in regulation of membrane protease activity
LVLLFVELTGAGGFFFVFFGGTAILVGTLVGVGLGGPEWWQWLLFASVSLVSAILFRPRLVHRFRPHSSSADIDSLENQIAIAAEEIAPESTGQVQMRGTTWSARNLGPGNLAKGQRCRVERSIGIMVEVHPLALSVEADGAETNSVNPTV